MFVETKTKHNEQLPLRYLENGGRDERHGVPFAAIAKE